MGLFKGCVAVIDSKGMMVRLSKVDHPHHRLGGEVIPVHYYPPGIMLRVHDSVTFEIIKVGGLSCADDVRLENELLGRRK